MSQRFCYPDEYGLELPILVLAIYEREAEAWEPSIEGAAKYQLRTDGAERLRLLPLRHQTAGIGCHHHDLWAIPLEPRPEAVAGLYRLEKFWYGTNAGALGVSLDELEVYRAQLRTWLRVDCAWSYRYFEEGIYPIDATAEHLRRLTVQELPEELDELLEWTRPDDPEDPQQREWVVMLRRFCGYFGRWTLFVLGENSD